jgi:predicted negative regulator of RcsB-dependent stress response
MQNDNKTMHTIMGFVILTVIILGLLIGLLFGWQWFKVYSREQSGKAQLAEATFSKQVQLEEAKANLEAQKLNSQAEVERAKGAAQAIAIESGKLTENYIRYLWVQQQKNLNDKTIIYVPTEAGLPVLEAGRLPGEK